MFGHIARKREKRRTAQEKQNPDYALIQEEKKKRQSEEFKRDPNTFAMNALFGEKGKVRKSNQLADERSAFEKQKADYQSQSPQRNLERESAQNQLVSQKTAQAKTDRQQALEEGRQRAIEFMNRDVQGLAPEQRSALQYEASRNIDRNMESANRRLLGDQAQRGIVGKGGVGYAQQRDLQRMGMEAEGGVRRDLDKLNADMRLKNLAAMFNIEQGEAAQSQLDKQLAVDEIQLADERKRQRAFEDQFNRLFSRV